MKPQSATIQVRAIGYCFHVVPLCLSFYSELKAASFVSIETTRGIERSQYLFSKYNHLLSWQPSVCYPTVI